MKRMFFLFLALVAMTASSASAATDGSYKVRAGDTLQIEVLEDTTLNRSVLVLPDGRFNFPYAGSIAASGKTVTQVQQAVSSGISSEFREPPTVFVSVASIPKRTSSGGGASVASLDVYLLGEVNAPGAKAVKRGTTVLQFLAQSGGFTKFAATKRLQLRRRDAAGIERVYKINYRALSDGAVLEDNIVLRDGDVLLVPERRLFE